ncbi:MAG: PEP-utilizing enzyme [Lachnospiraceae bacterium]|nr:PEP-utilizing enzyme [Lachnospiraceae bacterium]
MDFTASYNCVTSEYAVLRKFVSGGAYVTPSKKDVCGNAGFDVRLSNAEADSENAGFDAVKNFSESDAATAGFDTVKCFSEGDASTAGFDIEKEKADFDLLREEILTVIDARITGFTVMAALNSADSGSKEIIDILEARRMFLDDEEFVNSVLAEIETGKFCARDAAIKVLDSYIEVFAASGDDMLRGKVEDLTDLRTEFEKRDGNYSFGENGDGTTHTGFDTSFTGESDTDEPAIYYAPVFSVSDVLSLSSANAVGLIFTSGGLNSHGLIVAKALGIPAVVGADGAMCADNEEKMCRIVAPVRKTYLRSSGHPLYANIFTAEDVRGDLFAEAVSDSGAYDVQSTSVSGIFDGVGLFRTEGLFFSLGHIPSYDEFREIFSDVSRKLAGKSVTVRIFDVDEDKMPPCLGEFNGLRGIEYALTRREILESEIRAIIAGNVSGNLKLLIPVTEEASQIRAVKEIVEKAIALSRGSESFDESNVSNRSETISESSVSYNSEIISKSSVSYNSEIISKSNNSCITDTYTDSSQIEIGIMIENMRGVEALDTLLPIADFVNIGSNDLIKDLYKIPREAGLPADLSELLDTISVICHKAHSASYHVCLCGELASSADYRQALIKAGVDSFSVSI